MKGFIFLTDPIFTKVSDFTNGYAEATYRRYLNDSNEVTRQSYATKIDESSEFISTNGKRFSTKELAIEDSGTKDSSSKQVDLTPFEENNLWGFKDDSRVIIKPVYKEAQPFKNGFARVNFDGQKGLINEEGNVVLYDDFYLTGDVYHNILWYQKFVYKTFLHSTFSGWENRTEKHVMFGYLIYSDLQTELNCLMNKHSDLNKKLVGRMPPHELDSIRRELKALEYKIHHALRVKAGKTGELFWEGYY